MTDAAHPPVRRTIALRWNDFDVLGHLNQAVYHELLEEGRSALLAAADADPREYVLVRVELDYRREIPLEMPEVTVETAVERIGGASLRLAQRIVRADGEVAAAGTCVTVGWDGRTRRSRPLRERERAALARWTVPVGDAA